MKRATPWPQMGTAEDIAGAVLYFCLPQSQWVTGQVLKCRRRHDNWCRLVPVEYYRSERIYEKR